MEKQHSIKQVIFAADGILGYSHLGAILFLSQHNSNFFNDISTFVGASIGSIWSLLLSMNISSEIVIKFAFELLLHDFKNGISNISYQNLRENFGFTACKYENLKYIIDQIFCKGECTFKAHYLKFKKHLIISGYNIDLMKIEYFDYINTPDMKLLDAVNISCSIPGMFEPVLYNNYLYIDPIISERIPLNSGSSITNHKEILIINCILHTYSNTIDKKNHKMSFLNYLYRIFMASLKFSNNEALDGQYLSTEIYVPMGFQFLHNLSLSDIDSMVIFGYFKTKRLFLDI